MAAFANFFTSLLSVFGHDAEEIAARISADGISLWRAYYLDARDVFVGRGGTAEDFKILVLRFESRKSYGTIRAQCLATAAILTAYGSMVDAEPATEGNRWIEGLIGLDVETSFYGQDARFEPGFIMNLYAGLV